MKYISIALSASLCMFDVGLSVALAEEGQSERVANPVSPARGINHPIMREEPLKRLRSRNAQRPEDELFRSFDGRDNNLTDAEMGATHIQLKRLMPAAYTDGIWTMAGATRPGARAISNAIATQTTDMPNAQRAAIFCGSGASS